MLEPLEEINLIFKLWPWVCHALCTQSGILIPSLSTRDTRLGKLISLFCHLDITEVTSKYPWLGRFTWSLLCVHSIRGQEYAMSMHYDPPGASIKIWELSMGIFKVVFYNYCTWSKIKKVDS